MAGVVGHGRVADAVVRIGWVLVLGDTGQIAATPGGTAIGRSSESDVGCAAIEETASLGRHNDGVAEGERVRFDLSLVLAGTVGVGIEADLGERDVGEGCYGRRKGEH